GPYRYKNHQQDRQPAGPSSHEACRTMSQTVRPERPFAAAAFGAAFAFFALCYLGYLGWRGFGWDGDSVVSAAQFVKLTNWRIYGTPDGGTHPKLGCILLFGLIYRLTGGLELL